MEALVYDVHGNLLALEAVLEDAHRNGATRYVLGGDYTLFGGWPSETVERLKQLADALWIRGNGERWTHYTDNAPTYARPAIEACRHALGERLVEDLAALPTSARRGDTLICHASPISDLRSFGPEPTEDDAFLLAHTDAARLIFGHTHIQFERTTAGGTQLINPGSVGLPFDGDPRAAYTLLHADGTITRRRVAYDHHAAAAKVRQCGEWGETIARRIERATRVPD